MTTETVKIPDKEELLEEGKQEGEEVVVEYSEQEQKAMDDGWVPKDQWKGNPDDWRPAKEFNDRGELFTRIKSQSKELQEIKEAMSFLTKQNKDRYLAGVNDTLAQLKEARRSALEDGNIVAAEEIRDKMDEVKEQARAATATQVVPKPVGPTATFEKWHEKNEWYMKDDDLTAVADKKGLNFKKNNPESSEADMLAFVSKEVQKVFPDKFPSRSPPSPNGNGRESPRGRATEGLTSKLKEVEEGMGEENTRIMKTIMKQTGMTKEEYLKQYAA